MSSIYGSDISTFPTGGGVDIDPSLATIEGPRVILELCARRLMTPRGFLDDAPDAGFDLMAQMGRRLTSVAKLRLQQDIRAELIRVGGVLDVSVANMVETTGGSFRIPISITLADGRHSLVLEASSLDVKLIRADKG